MEEFREELENHMIAQGISGLGAPQIISSESLGDYGYILMENLGGQTLY